MKILTGNRLTDGVAVWYAGDGSWAERIDAALTVSDKAGETELEAIGKGAAAANLVVDLDLVDVEMKEGRLVPLRLRERIRAAGPSNRTDLGKQAEKAA